VRRNDRRDTPLKVQFFISEFIGILLVCNHDATAWVNRDDPEQNNNTSAVVLTYREITFLAAERLDEETRFLLLEPGPFGSLMFLII
jgi:hypothetical protein